MRRRSKTDPGDAGQQGEASSPKNGACSGPRLLGLLVVDALLLVRGKNAGCIGRSGRWAYLRPNIHSHICIEIVVDRPSASVVSSRHDSGDGLCLEIDSQLQPQPRVQADAVSNSELLVNLGECGEEPAFASGLLAHK